MNDLSVIATVIDLMDKIMPLNAYFYGLCVGMLLFLVKNKLIYRSLHSRPGYFKFCPVNFLVRFVTQLFFKNAQ